MERFDAIIFNEVLYYFQDPVREVERYERALRWGGIFITSLYEKSRRAVAIGRALKRRYPMLADAGVTGHAPDGSSKSWRINVLMPKGRTALELSEATPRLK
jgi:hypothetical protein